MGYLVTSFLTFASQAYGHQQPIPSADHRQQGLTYLSQGQFERALVELRAASEIDPDDGVVRDAIGVALGEIGQLESALIEFRRATEVAPDLAEAHFHLGLALERTGDTRQALLEYQHAVRLKPALLEARHGLGSVSARLGDFDGAIQQFQQVAEALPDFAEARYNLGLTLWSRYKSATGPRHMPDLDGALEGLKSAVRLAQGEAKYHAALGQLLADRDNLAGAVNSLRQAQMLARGRPDFCVRPWAGSAQERRFGRRRSAASAGHRRIPASTRSASCAGSGLATER